MIASGEKTIETRTWRTRHRGPLLIVSALKPQTAPAGMALAIADLVDCRQMTIDDEEAARCQLYTRAQAWVLENIRAIEPFPIKGQRGVFETGLDPSTIEEMIVVPGGAE